MDAVLLKAEVSEGVSIPDQIHVLEQDVVAEAADKVGCNNLGSHHLAKCLLAMTFGFVFLHFLKQLME